MDPAQPNNPNPVTPKASVESAVAQAPNSQNPTGGSSSLPSWFKPIAVIVAICLMIIAGVLIWLLAFNNSAKSGSSLKKVTSPTQAPSTTQISGNILFQGYASPDAYLIIAEKEKGEEQFKSVVTGLNPTIGAISWTWKDAKAGKNYEIQAQLKIKGNIVQTSTSNVVSAPASNVNLVMVSNSQPPTPVVTQITGNVNINGYIPQGANVIIIADTSSGPGGQTKLPGITAVDDTSFSWNNAVSGTSYDLTAQLVDSSGNQIATPAQINVTAPSSNLQFNINSTAQPPAPTISGLSGNIIINGTIPANSYITLGSRVTGSSTFNQIINNLSSTSGVSWNWQQAQAGTSYDIQAYLWSNNQPFAESSITTIAAPADGINLTINAQQPTSAPGSNTMSISCNGQQGGSYQATINYNTAGNLQNAQSYNIIVTLASQGSQILNTVVNPPNPTQPQNLTSAYVFIPGATYYAQYAYSTSSTDNNFSPLSPAIQFACR